MDTHGVKIQLWDRRGERGPGGSLVVDGTDLSAMATGFTLTYGEDHTPRLTLTVDLVVHETELAGCDVELIIPDEVRGLLVKWGWTPPEG